MAKNIVIAEGGTAKNFTAKKLQTNQQGSGTVNWVPEDEVLDYVNLKDHKFTANGTFSPEDFNCDGFNEVEIAIPADVKEKTITANGEFYAADDHCMGYNKVIVAVPGGGGGGPYTVNFFDEQGNIIKTDANVPYDGSASCTLLDGTVRDGQYFKGWNPKPEHVTENMNCYPVYGDYVIDPNEIQDDWVTICADGGAHYPLGAYKSLIIDVYDDDYYNAYSEEDGVTGKIIRLSNKMEYYDNKYALKVPNGSNFGHTSFLSVACHMVKVAEGEDGSTSTWLSTGCAVLHVMNTTSNGWLRLSPNLDGTSLANANLQYYAPVANYGSIISTDYSDHPFRYLLETILFRNLPTSLKEHIRSVSKTFKGVSTPALQTKTPVDKTCDPKIWVPSRKELSSYIANSFSVDSTVKWDAEFTGIDYSLIYMPSYHTTYPRLFLRSMGAFDDVSRWSNSFICLTADNTKMEVLHGFNMVDLCIPFGFCL